MLQKYERKDKNIIIGKKPLIQAKNIQLFIYKGNTMLLDLSSNNLYTGTHDEVINYMMEVGRW